MTEHNNSRKQRREGTSPKMCVEITSSTLPFLIQFVNSAFKLSSYFLASIFLMTILFLKLMKFSGDNSLKRNTTKLNKIMKKKRHIHTHKKKIPQRCFSIMHFINRIISYLKVQAVGLIFLP